MAKKEKNYIKGSARELQFGAVAIDVNVEDLEKIKNERGYAKVIVAKRLEEDQYGNTHYMYENDWKPNQEEDSKPKKKAKKKAAVVEDEDDDLPF